MNKHEWIATVQHAVSQRGSPLSATEQEILNQPFIAGDAIQKALIERLANPLLSEIIERGRDARSFGDPARLQDQILYGLVESVYAGASSTFLNVTRSFLTFWREYLDIADNTPQTVLQRALIEMVSAYKQVFFPAINIRTPAPHMIFAGEQRRVLTEFGNGIDVEEFFRSNPLLDRTANPLKGSGCFGVLALLLTAALLLSLVYP